MPKRIVMIVALALAAVATACTAMPGTTLEDGGTYAVEVSIPAQEVTNEFPLPFGLGSCIAAITTPEVDVPGTTVELPPFEYAPGDPTASIPAVTIELPRSRVSAGSFSLACNGVELGRIGVAIEFEGTATISSATLHLDTRTLILADPVLEVRDAEATFAGAPADTPPVPLEPFSLELPELIIRP
jgi:hypothetical protein